MDHSKLNMRMHQNFYAAASLRSDAFVNDILPWLIGIPLSLIIIHVFSL